MKLTNREKVLLPALLIFILSALFINFIYLPLNKEIKDLKTQSADLEIKISGLKAKQTELETLKQQYSDLSGQIEEDNPDIMKIWDQPELLVSLESIMSNRADQTSINFYDTIATEVLQAGEVDVTFDTNYSNLQYIAKKLEEGKYFNTIPSYSVSKIETGSEENKLKYDLEVSMKLLFYSTAIQQEFADKYDFMMGSFGKNELFQ